MFDYGTTEVTVQAKDKLADLVMKRYREAVAWQSIELVGSKCLKTVLEECYQQANSILSPRDREVVEELGVDAYISLTAMKGGVIQAFLIESLVSADGLPWTIKPTPLPDLSERGQLEALNLVKQELFAGNGLEMDLITLLRNVKAQVRGKETQLAEEASRNMEKLMFDQLVEGSWRQAMSSFLYNFVFYPYGVLHGPIPTRKPRLSWSNDRIKVKNEMFYSWEAISPWDFWYSPDSRSTQDGTAVFIRKRMTRRHLLEMKEMKSYLKDQVEAVLVETETKDLYNFRWMSSNPDQPDRQMVYWANCTGTIDALVHYGLVSGRELAEYGLSGLEPGKYYDATITVIGGYTVQVFVAPDPTVNIRPVFTASFYRTRDRIANFGIGQRIRDVERAFLVALRYLIRNMAGASEPITEIDRARFSKFMTDEQLVQCSPGTVFIADNDPLGSQAPGLRYYTAPNALPALSQLMQYFMELSHIVTNVPASLHGTAEGTGANRTFRGMANLQSNAVKSLQAAVGNIDETVFLPMGELLYGYNMLYEDDESLKGDSKVQAQGVLGLLAREMERNNALELLQLIGSVGAQLGASVTPLVDWALQKTLLAMRVPSELAAKVSFAAAAGPNGPPTEGGTPPEAMTGAETAPVVSEEVPM
ncbi:MAG: hypothetical protein LBS60_08980 [Deltaproteobacteria bacterium]|jgi:hypothetical protein|nr:hypothetical protein [Deltaproteobacteria bacterium]